MSQRFVFDKSCRSCVRRLIIVLTQWYRNHSSHFTMANGLLASLVVDGLFSLPWVVDESCAILAFPNTILLDILFVDWFVGWLCQFISSLVLTVRLALLLLTGVFTWLILIGWFRWFDKSFAGNFWVRCMLSFNAWARGSSRGSSSMNPVQVVWIAWQLCCWSRYTAANSLSPLSVAVLPWTGGLSLTNPYQQSEYDLLVWKLLIWLDDS